MKVYFDKLSGSPVGLPTGLLAQGPREILESAWVKAHAIERRGRTPKFFLDQCLIINSGYSRVNDRIIRSLSTNSSVRIGKIALTASPAAVNEGWNLVEEIPEQQILESLMPVTILKNKFHPAAKGSVNYPHDEA